MIKEFKEFITRGNVVDLAVGVIVGGAFGKIVTSLVDDILMPLIGIISGGVDISTKLTWTVGTAELKFGLFLQNIIDFLIVAFCIFLFVKICNNISKIGKKKEVKEEVVSEEILLLREINKSLKKSNK